MRTFSALLLTALMVAPAFAYTDEQVAACTPDVMRLCSDAIPDEAHHQVYDAEKEASQHGVHDDFQVRDFNLSRCSPIRLSLQVFSSGFPGRIDFASSGSPHDRTPQ